MGNILRAPRLQAKGGPGQAGRLSYELRWRPGQEPTSAFGFSRFPAAKNGPFGGFRALFRRGNGLSEPPVRPFYPRGQAFRPPGSDTPTPGVGHSAPRGQTHRPPGSDTPTPGVRHTDPRGQALRPPGSDTLTPGVGQADPRPQEALPSGSDSLTLGEKRAAQGPSLVASQEAEMGGNGHADLLVGPFSEPRCPAFALAASHRQNPPGTR